MVIMLHHILVKLLTVQIRWDKTAEYNLFAFGIYLFIVFLIIQGKSLFYITEISKPEKGSFPLIAKLVCPPQTAKGLRFRSQSAKP